MISIAVVACATAAFGNDATPVNPSTIEVYHVNQANYTGISNMNTADAAGDAFFDMRSLLQYYQCNINKTGGHAYPGECTNPEVIADNLVVTKVEVLVANGDFGKYGECNVCVNGTVPFTHPEQKCVDGSYHCRCSGLIPYRDAPCPPQPGRELVKTLIDGFSKYVNLNVTGPSFHWMVNLANRVGGTWYSTVDAGNCDSSSAKSCQWKLSKTLKEVNATCQSNKVQSTVEKLGQKCFASCPGGEIDTHTPCYIECYYKTLLGENSGSTVPSLGGLSGTQITQIWTDAFDACPALPPRE